MRFRSFIAASSAALVLAGCVGRLPGTATAAPGSAFAAKATVASVPAAADLALRALRGNIHTVQVPAMPAERQVVYAGKNHFGALWARDGMYASLGLLAAGETTVVHDSMTALLDGQRADGLIPRRVGNGSNVVGVVRAAIGLKPSDSAVFQTYDFSKPSIDTNPLLIWVADEYLKKTNDEVFQAQYKIALERAAGYLFAHEDGGLLKQDAYSDWKDMVARGGKVLYSNAVYYKALVALADIERRAGDDTQAATYETRANALASHIQAAFWDTSANHFRDTTDLAQFSPDGDLFAVLFGLAKPWQKDAIFARCEALLTLQPLLPALDGDYPSSMIPLQLRVAGIPHYHDRYEWPWLTSLYAWAAAESGDPQRATRALTRVASLALRDNTFEEIYEGTQPKPVKTNLYASEVDFSWSAGMFLSARTAVGGL